MGMKEQITPHFCGRTTSDTNYSSKWSAFYTFIKGLGGDLQQCYICKCSALTVIISPINDPQPKLLLNLLLALHPTSKKRTISISLLQ